MIGSLSPNLLFVGARGIALAESLQQLVEVTSSAFACKIGVIRWGYKANSLGSAAKHIADVISQGLQLVCSEANLIVNDVVVCGSASSMNTSMR